MLAGFVAVSKALVGANLERMQAASDKQIREMMALDPQRVGNRNSHRYCAFARNNPPVACDS